MEHIRVAGEYPGELQSAVADVNDCSEGSRWQLHAATESKQNQSGVWDFHWSLRSFPEFIGDHQRVLHTSAVRSCTDTILCARPIVSFVRSCLYIYISDAVFLLNLFSLQTRGWRTSNKKGKKCLFCSVFHSSWTLRVIKEESREESAKLHSLYKKKKI